MQKCTLDVYACVYACRRAAQYSYYKYITYTYVSSFSKASFIVVCRLWRAYAGRDACLLLWKMEHRIDCWPCTPIEKMLHLENARIPCQSWESWNFKAISGPGWRVCRFFPSTEFRHAAFKDVTVSSYAVRADTTETWRNGSTSSVYIWISDQYVNKRNTRADILCYWGRPSVCAANWLHQ
jgi:hypothetical protein